jgi:hypothetical protein
MRRPVLTLPPLLARNVARRRRGSSPAAPSGSPLDSLIAPEITGDRFHRAIMDVAAKPGIHQILEIGSSSGEGSTEAWVAGALRNPVRPQLHCIEVSETRFDALVERWREYDFVCCHHVSSVPVESFPDAATVEAFYRGTRSKLRRTPLEEVLDWLRHDLDYVREHGLSRPGIREIREQHRIDTFDAVLIDGSEFTGRAELDEVYGAGFLLLDDTQTYKNYGNARRLEADPCYRLVLASRRTRNGFAVFQRVG